MSSELSFKLNDLKEVIRKWIYLEDASMIDVMLAAYVANEFDADPTWVLFLGPPSSAKTELLRMLDGHPRAYFLSNLTPNTFISGKEGNRQSLLFELTNKTLIIKEFGTMLMMRSEQQNEILAQLREIYDGKYRKAFGNGKSIDWEGRVGLLASATPVYDRHHSVNSALGERFLVYRIRKGNADAIARKAQEDINKEPRMREELQNATHRFVEQFSAKSISEAKMRISDDHKAVLRNLASFCAQARCHVPRDRYTRRVDQLPTPEEPARLVKQLTIMAGALALINGRESTSTEILEVAKRLATDMVPPLRLKVIEKLYTGKIEREKWLTTKALSESLVLPTSTILMILEELMMLDLIERRQEGAGSKARQHWALSKSCKVWLGATSAIDVAPRKSLPRKIRVSI